MKIFVADKIAPAGVQSLRDAGFEVDFTTGLSEAEACEHIKDCDGVIVRSATSIRGAILEAGNALKVIGRAGIGVDNIDIDGATERGIVVQNTPDANATTTAELAIAHLLSLSRHLPQADSSVRSGKWERSAFMGSELSGKTLGVIGFGTIGRIVAQRALGLKMRVMGHDPFVTREVFEAEGVEAADLEELVRGCDYITLHCPKTEKTAGIINAERIAMMKPGTRIINCARGGLIDEQALYDALTSGHLAGAALDVYEQEPPTGSKLLELANCVFTPHLGASTQEAQVAVGVQIAEQVATFLNTGQSINAVNLPAVSGDELRRLRPYQELARRLGRLAAQMAPGPVQQLEVSVRGRAAELDAHAIAVEALVGLLGEHLSGPVNRVNASHIARKQGTTLVETRSDETHAYLSSVTVTSRLEDTSVSLSGTLFDERHLRLVRINDCEIETVLEGHLLITRHEDRPGVIGALGALLGEHDVNINGMHVGVDESGQRAVAVLTVSALLDDELMGRVTEIPAIEKALQISF